MFFSCVKRSSFLPTKNKRRFVLCETLTCVILSADARIASLPASADSSVHAGIRVTQVNLDFAVISSKSSRTAATQACDWMDGPEECGWGGDEGGGAVEAENADALHVVLTRLAKAHVIVEWENLPQHTSLSFILHKALASFVTT